MWRRLRGVIDLLRGCCNDALSPSRSGEIGRRARLKIWCPQGRVGSSPSSGIARSLSRSNSPPASRAVRSPIDSETERRGDRAMQSNVAIEVSGVGRAGVRPDR